jgi:uncharacterized protein (TIGR00299 family) protein
VIGWLDCAAGASGDMLLGALVDAGVPLTVLQEAVDGLGVERVRLRGESTTRHALGATRVLVDAAPDATPRTWADVRGVLDRAGLVVPVRAAATEAFARLARAEAGVHRVDPDRVHFHEVGALDALADVVGVCAGLHHLGLDRLHASPVALGSGASRGAHGVVPVPAPAVLALLAEAGAPVYGGAAAYEMCTPTGAALLATHVAGWGPLPPMAVTRVGHGAGGRDLAEVPNLVRLVLGEPAPHPADSPVSSPAGGIEPAVVLEANVDDQDPRLWPPALAALLAAGASDAWLTGIVMKKGRPGQTLHVLAPPAAVPAIRAAVFAHTTTIGLRQTHVGKYALPRVEADVEVDGHRIRVKRALADGSAVNASLEYEDEAAAAAALGVPAKAVLARATAAAVAAGLLP